MNDMKVYYKLAPLDDLAGMYEEDTHAHDRKMTMQIVSHNSDKLKEVREWFELMDIDWQKLKIEFIWNKNYSNFITETALKMELPDDIALMFQLRFK